jgi:integrase
VRIAKAAKWNATSRTRDVGPTKTRRSRRVVTLPAEVVTALEPLVDRPAGDRLFLAPRGGHIRHKPVWDAWVDARKKAKLDAPLPRIHDLRHTHVAWLIAAGVPLPVIQRRLGHESIKTTIDRYGHLLPELEAAATEAASLAMRPRLELLPADD